MISHRAPNWSFHPPIDCNRQSRLLGYSRYEEVVAELLMTTDVQQFVWEPYRRRRLSGCHRAAYLVKVAPTAYDAFFNSPCGYRGQFACSSSQGEKANRFLLDSLTPELMAAVSGLPADEQGLFQQSMASRGAKAWICEREVEEHMGDDVPEIDFPPWTAAAPTAETDGAGLRAPVGTHLQIMGGWLGPSGCEQVDPHKAGRSDEIHKFGFT